MPVFNVRAQGRSNVDLLESLSIFPPCIAPQTAPYAAGQLDDASYGHNHVSTKQPLLVDFLHCVGLAACQMAKQNPILLTKSARLYTRFRASSFTAPIR